MPAGEEGGTPIGLEAGSVLAGCRIERRIGRGGMGTVYLARQLDLGRSVALKVVNPALADDAGFLERFRSETRIAARVEHPNVVPLYEAGEEGGVLYMLMRYIRGRDLRALLDAGGPLAPRRAAALIAQAAAGLDAVHAAGLVHRDLKPANVLVAESAGSEHAYLTDFGLAKRASSFSGPTMTGHFLGTLDYIAPEQLTGQPVDARADVYALGCLLFELLTGSVPYPREDSAATMWAHVNHPPPAPSKLGGAALAGFDEVIRRAMAKKPGLRYPSAGDVGRAALAVAQGRRPDESRGSVATGGAAPTRIHEAAPTRAAATFPPDPGGGGEPTRARSGARSAGRASGRRLFPALSALAAAILALAAVATLSVAGVLGGDEDNPAPPPSPSPSGTGPSGELTATGIGEIQVGATAEEVEAAFGRPDDRGPTGPIQGIRTQTVWTYEIPDGEPSEDSLRLYFDFQASDASQELSGYSSVTDQLGTAEGVTSGTALDELRSAYGERLEQGPPQVQTPATYIVRESPPDDYPALVFGIQSGKVGAIEGGDPPPTLGFAE